MPDHDFYAAAPCIAHIRHIKQILGLEDRKRLLKQLLILIEEYYVHLPLKVASFAIDPVHELRILQDSEEILHDDALFMRHVLRIFHSLRDRHTTLSLPRPWANMVAYLPILVEQFYVGAEPQYIISKKLFGYVNEAIVIGSRITHWNGVPIDTYLTHVLGVQSQGSNTAAALRLALENLTIRPLAYCLLPDEDWVTLSCISQQGEPETISLPWKYFVEQRGLPTSSANTCSGADHGLYTGLDLRMFHVNYYISLLFMAPPKLEPKMNLKTMTTVDNILKYGVLHTAHGAVGYIRIYSFEVGDLVAFIMKIVSILQCLPQDRLIIDVRNNPGGMIPAGQSLVQFLSPRPISVSPITFRNTHATRAFADLPDFAPWGPSLKLMNITGEQFAQLFPVTDVYALPPYRYPGKSALIIDALSYSTCDFMAADFKDNRVGVIVGTDSSTGGGGANVWSYEVLAQYARQAGDASLEPLPQGMGLNISMRRSVRTGQHSGLPVENFGVAADFVHRLTYEDLIHDNVDLLNYTASLLS
jgi:hypothetical protein